MIVHWWRRSGKEGLGGEWPAGNPDSPLFTLFNDRPNWIFEYFDQYDNFFALFPGTFDLRRGAHFCQNIIPYMVDPKIRAFLFSISLDCVWGTVWVGGGSKMKTSAGASDRNGGKTRPNRFIDLEKSHLFCFLKAHSPVSAIYATCSSCFEKPGWILKTNHVVSSILKSWLNHFFTFFFIFSLHCLFDLSLSECWD